MRYLPRRYEHFVTWCAQFLHLDRVPVDGGGRVWWCLAAPAVVAGVRSHPSTSVFIHLLWHLLWRVSYVMGCVCCYTLLPSPHDFDVAVGCSCLIGD